MNQILSLLPKNTALHELQQYCTTAYLQWRGVTTSTELLDQLVPLKPDIVIVATYLCGYNSSQIIKEIRSVSFHTRIVVLLKEYSVSERMEQFKNGADDILSLPYNPRECFLRIQRLLQYQRIFASHEYTIAPNIFYHPKNCMLQVREQSFPLRRREGQVLACLAQHKSLVVSREQIAKWVWGDTSLASLSTVDVYIKRLRQSIPSSCELIKTVRGIGYQLIHEEVN